MLLTDRQTNRQTNATGNIILKNLKPFMGCRLESGVNFNESDQNLSYKLLLQLTKTDKQCTKLTQLLNVLRLTETHHIPN